ncbi:MAG: spore coat U domain-containing protein [Terracidiphilus sp.]|jgi:spore coat protein U-like protein
MKLSYALGSAALLGFVALGLTSTSAFATTATTPFTVSATVQGSCTISATNLSFGAYTGTAISANSTITVNCTGGTTYNVGLNPGTSTNATVTTRKMTGQYKGGTLAYGLFQNSGFSTNWGQTVGTDTEPGTGINANQTLTVYGNVPAGTAPAADGYFDTITATITY